MTITRDDFLRLIPKALDGYNFEINGQTIQIPLGNGVIIILFERETTRMIGALKLPVTHITFCFENISQNETHKFFNKFDLAYQKGGG